MIRNDTKGRKYLYDILEIKKIGSDLPLVVSNSKRVQLYLEVQITYLYNTNVNNFKIHNSLVFLGMV